MPKFPGEFHRTIKAGVSDALAARLATMAAAAQCTQAEMLRRLIAGAVMRPEISVNVGADPCGCASVASGTDEV